MPRPRVTHDDVEGEKYVRGSKLCVKFDFSATYLAKLKRMPGFPYIPLPGGESRYLVSEVRKWMSEVGEEDRDRTRPAQVARAKAARAAIGKTGED